MAMTPEQRTARAKKAAESRWSRTTAQERREVLEASREGLLTTEKLREIAAKLGYDLVPLARS